MSVFRKRFVSVLLALSMIGTVSAFTVYADELDGTVTDGDYVVDDSNTSDYTPPADTPVEDTPVVDTPVVDDVPADDTGNYSDDTTTDTPDYSYDDSYSDTGSQDNYVTDDTIDYGTDSGYQDYYTDDSYVEYYEPQYDDYAYDYGMSFEEFERATDYSSAIVDTESPTVDMYNSNGSDTETLSSEDWNDIKLNLGETSADGTGDFSFIKDNTSDENSNKSILFLIFGIIFVLASVSLIVYMIVSAIRSRKLEKSGAYSGYYDSNASRRKHTSKRVDPHATKRTKFTYDTGEIDITKYNDEF